jgi:hypothetical protein
VSIKRAGVVVTVNLLLCAAGLIASVSAEAMTKRELPHICDPNDFSSEICFESDFPMPFDCSTDGLDDCEIGAYIFGCPEVQFNSGECWDDASCGGGAVVCYKQN